MAYSPGLAHSAYPGQDRPLKFQPQRGCDPYGKTATPLGLLDLTLPSSSQGSRYALLRSNPGLEIATPLGLRLKIDLGA